MNQSEISFGKEPMRLSSIGGSAFYVTEAGWMAC
jgi:hypothetical protein